MARPLKSGLDYFPLDTILNDKIMLLEAEFGLTGFGMIIKLFQKIYADGGYYCNWSNEVALLFSRSVREGRNVVSQVLDCAFKREIFSPVMYRRYNILTSKSIQQRYFTIVSKRKQVTVIKEYLLICAADFKVISVINSVNDGINSVNDGDNTQSKVKESKAKESKVQEICLQERKRNSALTIPSTEGSFTLTHNEVKALSEKYSQVDIKQSLNKLCYFLQSEPDKQRSFKGTRAYIELWLQTDANRLQEKQQNAQRYRQNQVHNLGDSQPPSYDLKAYEDFSIFD